MKIETHPVSLGHLFKRVDDLLKLLNPTDFMHVLDCRGNNAVVKTEHLLYMVPKLKLSPTTPVMQN